MQAGITESDGVL